MTHATNLVLAAIQPGTTVHHPLYGNGTVKAITSMRRDPTPDTTIIGVYFPAYGMREFVWANAKDEITIVTHAFHVLVPLIITEAIKNKLTAKWYNPLTLEIRGSGLKNFDKIDTLLACVEFKIEATWKAPPAINVREYIFTINFKPE